MELRYSDVQWKRNTPARSHCYVRNYPKVLSRMKRSRSVVYLSGEKIGIETNCKVLAKFFEMLKHEKKETEQNPALLLNSTVICECQNVAGEKT